MPRFRALLACVFAAALVFGACGDDDEDTAGDDSSADTSESTSDDGAGGGEDVGSGATGAVIDIVDFEYEPSELTAEAGAEITLVNADGTAHTVTADGGEFDGEADGGEESTFTAPDEAGAYSYYCKFHPFMTGSVVVG